MCDGSLQGKKERVGRCGVEDAGLGSPTAGPCARYCIKPSHRPRALPRLPNNAVNIGYVRSLQKSPTLTDREPCMISSSAASQDATTDETGSSPPGSESPDGESAVSEEIEPGSGSDEAEIDDGEEQQAGAEVQGGGTKKHRRQKERRMREKRKRKYEELLLDALADDVRGPSLRGSRIGVSYWMAEEKERHFDALARYGCDNLQKIAKAIGTKSEAEVEQYLLLLNDGLRDQNDRVRRKRRNYFSRIDVPAACEISGGCEETLDQAADTSATSAWISDAKVEQQTVGKCWLIDVEIADEIEARLVETLAEEQNGSNGGDGESTTFLTNSTAFFDTPMLLQLSRNLFMNGPPEGCWNYRTIELLAQPAIDSAEYSPSPSGEGDIFARAASEPAIYRSALEDLHKLATDVTEKLVHATLFQATSRLRAKHAESPPAPVVLASDVHVATDLLGMNLDWKSYWAKLPRRTGLEVYSDSTKYRRGRTGTKNGVKLTYDEVEAELGLEKPASATQENGNASTDRLVTDREASDTRDDLEKEGNADSDDSDVSSDGIIELKLERERRKRRRGLSPDSFQRAEEQYMSAIDRQNDRTEDARLRELLGLEDRRENDAEVEMPDRPKLKKHFRREMRSGWREQKEAIAAWEVEYVRRLRDQQEESSSDEEIEYTQESEDESSVSGNGEDSAARDRRESVTHDEEMEFDE